MNTPVQTAAIQNVSVIDSHTAGEPTRVVLSGGPPLGDGPLHARCQRLRLEFDHWRSALACEPRGSDTMVGALLVEPHAPDCVAGVIFFNNVGVLGMCGHGAIGVVTTLAHLGRIGQGVHRIDTPVGVVSAQLHADGSVTIANVPSWRLAAQIQVDVPGIGPVHGDIAWGGNWFFLCDYTQGPLDLAQIESLTDYCWRIRQSLQRAGITGADGAEIDHIELSGAPLSGGSARNFVLCPGKAYDRSPCGTGTSAKLACLAADGKLAAGQLWSQESVIGSMFEASYSHGEAGRIHPSIRGRAWIMAQSTLYFASDDPFRHGIRA